MYETSSELKDKVENCIAEINENTDSIDRAFEVLAKVVKVLALQQKEAERIERQVKLLAIAIVAEFAAVVSLFWWVVQL